VALLAHLSDLHFQGPPQDAAIFDALVSALEAERARRGARFDLLAITGDVFDDGSVEPSSAAHHYAELHSRIDVALGGSVPTVIVPGNHDRRRIGLFSPHRADLFEALAAEMRHLGPHIRVHGCDAPFLAAVMEPELTGLVLWIVAYDSTYLPRGLLSAGGMMRQEDLLHAAAIIGDRQPDWPVLFLLHHHLVPTPLTDLHPVQVDRAPAPVRWAIEHALLPRARPNGPAPLPETSGQRGSRELTHRVDAVVAEGTAEVALAAVVTVRRQVDTLVRLAADDVATALRGRATERAVRSAGARLAAIRSGGATTASRCAGARTRRARPAVVVLWLWLLASAAQGDAEQQHACGESDATRRATALPGRSPGETRCES
jgi:hypothetical protein